jgi:hypothetical protein
MKRGTEAGGARERWGEVLLGGLAGLGVPMMLWGVRGSRGSRGSPVTVGAVAGLLGALVGGRLARRTREAPLMTEAEAAPGSTPAEPRRGPNGRERAWSVEGNEAHTH